MSVGHKEETPPPASAGGGHDEGRREPPPLRKSLLWRLVEIAIFIGVAGMLAMVTIQVTSRLLGHSVPWTEEVTRYLFIWTTFLGLAAGFRSAEHTRITLLVLCLPARLRAAAVHLYFVAGVIFFGIVAFTGWRLVVQQFHSGESSPALGIGMYLVTSAVVAGAVLAVWAHIESLYLDRRTRELVESETVPQ